MIDRKHVNPEPVQTIKVFLTVGFAGLAVVALLYFTFGYLFFSLHATEQSTTAHQPDGQSSTEAPQVNTLQVVSSDSQQKFDSLAQREKTESATSTGTAATPASRASQPRTVKAATIDDLLLFYPDKFPIGNWNSSQLETTDVYFDSADGTRLHAWYLPSKTNGPIILFSHGNGGNLSHRTQILTFLHRRLDASVLIYDYRGYGRSEGIPTVNGVLEDAQAAATKLAELAQVDSSEIVLMGRSLGGAISIQLAAKEPFRALIVESSFSSLRQIADHLAPAELKPLVFLIPTQKLNSVATIKDHHGPFFQSHGQQDELIPIEMGQAVYQAANQPKTWISIPRSGHNGAYSDEYLDQLASFLSELAE